MFVYTMSRPGDIPKNDQRYLAAFRVLVSKGHFTDMVNWY